jgi:hypothetical protein
MTDADIRSSAPQARWDGRRVLFEVEHDGEEVPCAISSDVLRDLTARRCFKPKDVLACFVEARPQVEAIVHGKLRARITPSLMPLTIWSNDLDDYATASGEVDGAKP